MTAAAPRDQTGSQIAGSKYRRAYCSGCGDPIRVVITVGGCVPREPRCRSCEYPLSPGYAFAGGPADEPDESDAWRALAADLGVELHGEP